MVSPESRSRDEVHKRAEYERGGVPEYWLLDPHREEAWFFRRAESGRYEPARLDVEGRYTTPLLPEIALPVADLWRRPLPDPIELLRKWDLL